MAFLKKLKKSKKVDLPSEFSDGKRSSNGSWERRGGGGIPGELFAEDEELENRLKARRNNLSVSRSGRFKDKTKGRVQMSDGLFRPLANSPPPPSTDSPRPTAGERFAGAPQPPPGEPELALRGAWPLVATAASVAQPPAIH